MNRVCMVVCIVAFAVCVIACGGAKTPDRGSTEKGARPKATAEQQVKRKALIEKLISEGVFRELKITKNEVIVGPRFYTLDYKDKKEAAGIALAYIFAIPKDDKLQDDEEITLIDSKTGKDIGRYSSLGFTLD